ncbi:MAG: hypothetical protein KDD58_07720 [Bdellovibrionales bacterium]|nr:hypothetical protein [Bdellovibrionales bacterium]
MLSFNRIYGKILKFIGLNLESFIVLGICSSTHAEQYKSTIISRPVPIKLHLRNRTINLQYTEHDKQDILGKGGVAHVFKFNRDKVIKVLTKEHISKSSINKIRDANKLVMRIQKKYPGLFVNISSVQNVVAEYSDGRRVKTIGIIMKKMNRTVKDEMKDLKLNSHITYTLLDDDSNSDIYIENKLKFLANVWLKYVQLLKVYSIEGYNHCDISPKNIMVGYDNNLYVSDTDTTQKNNLKCMVYSDGSTAPETYNGENATYLSDLFSVADSMYQLITDKQIMFDHFLAKRIDAKEIYNTAYLRLQAVILREFKKLDMAIENSALSKNWQWFLHYLKGFILASHQYEPALRQKKLAQLMDLPESAELVDIYKKIEDYLVQFPQYSSLDSEHEIDLHDIFTKAQCDRFLSDEVLTDDLVFDEAFLEEFENIDH